MQYTKRNLSIILVIVLALIMIAIVIWVFDKRIENIEQKQPGQAGMIQTQNFLTYYHPNTNSQQINFTL